MNPYQRTGHKIKRNHSNALPRYVIAYDSETLPTSVNVNHYSASHRFRLGVTKAGRLAGGKMVGEEIRQHSTAESFWEYVYSYTGQRHTTWLVCHNALFDMIVSGMPERFMTGELSIDWPRSKRKREDNDEANHHAKGLCIIDSPPTIIAVRVGKTQGRLVIVDTLNWFPVPLATLGNSIGLEKLKMPAFEESNDVWWQYCTRDTEIVYRAFVQLVEWVRGNDFGMFRYTAPSQAMSAFRHRFMAHNIYPHDNDSAKSIERQAFFGGRTEVFRIGEFTERVHQLDVNSLFPSVMRDGYFPAILDRFERRDYYNAVQPLIDYSASVAEVDICTPEPLFPVRYDGRVCYPVGRFKTTLCGLELLYAKQRGYIMNVKSYATYKLQPIFKLWVEHLWNMRQEYKKSNNVLYDEFTKRLMNSLFGKFGQLSPDWINVSGKLAGLPWSRWTEINAGSGERTEFRSFGWQIQKQQGRNEVSGTFVAIPAFITAAARMRMNRLRAIAAYGEVYYQGVDSLIVNQKAYNELLNSGEVAATELGKLRHQHTAIEGDIWGCCQYRLDDKIVMSSRSNRVEITDGGKMMQRKFTAKQDLFNGKALNEVYEMTLPWEMSGTYSKGTIDKDGWISPLVLDQAPTSSNDGVNSELAAAEAN